MTVRAAAQAADPTFDRLVDDLIARLQAGEAMDWAAVERDHPEHADRLRSLAPALAALADLSQASDGAGSGATVARDSSDDLAAGLLGDFRIGREVGRGGMGIVYEATQISLSRPVALKVLPFAATMDPRHLQRFRHEAQAAALLHHPNIVPVYGVGCERGVHYYAMQLIEGRSLAAVIDDLRPASGGRKPPENETTDVAPGAFAPGSPDRATVPIAALSTQKTRRDKTHYRRIAELIAQAADALEYAHSMGVVHRDIKPGNLMLDDGGNLWVTDFGLAKLETAVELTMSGDLLGTLRYMSPEQALARHGLVDHRTDVYSLGATFYELLTLRPAVRGECKADILRHLSFEEPIALRKLDRAIPSELETISLKCLAKNPNERYTTAGELAADLQRFMEDKPIKARRPTIRQRLIRWARRHPGVTAAAGLVAGLLLAGTWAWHRETRHAETAARAVAAEADQLRDADRLPEALRAARNAADLLPRFGGDAALRQGIADRVADLQLLTGLEEARLEEASFRRDRIYFDIQQAAPRFRQAFMDYGVDVLGGDESAVVDALRRRAVAGPITAALDEWGRCVTEQGKKDRLGRLADALDPDPRHFASRTRLATHANDREALKKLAAEAERELPPAAVVAHLGDALFVVKSYPEAEKLLRAGQQRYPADFWVNHRLARLLGAMGPTRATESLRFFSAALVLRPLSPNVWLTASQALEAAGRPGEAETACRRAVELTPEFSTAQFVLGLHHARNNRLAEAAAAYRGALESEPGGHLIHLNLGIALMKLGRPAEAEASYRRAIDLKPDDYDVHANFGAALCDLGRPAEAEAECRRAIELNPDAFLAHRSLGNALRDLGRSVEAEAECRRAIKLNPDDYVAHLNLGNDLIDLGRPADAETECRRAIELKPDDYAAHLDLGVALQGLGRPAEAEAEYRRAIELKPDDNAAYANLGRTLNVEGRFAEGVAALRRAIELKPDDHSAHADLGNALGNQGRHAEAAAAFRRAIELKPDAPSTLRTAAWYFANCNDAARRDPQLAVELATKAVAKTPGDWRFQTTLGTAHYRAGHWQDAIKAMDKAMSLVPGDNAYYNLFFLAMSHWQLGDRDQAAKDYTQAIDLMDKDKSQEDNGRRFRAEAAELLGIRTEPKGDLPSPPKR